MNRSIRNGQTQFPANRPDRKGVTQAKAEALMVTLRLVIDADILISAALKPDGRQRIVFLLAITPPARLYVIDAVFDESARCSRARVCGFARSRSSRAEPRACRCGSTAITSDERP